MIERSESIKELATALALAQQEIEGAKKDSVNPFFKSKYADLSSVTEALRGIGKHGLSYIQIVHDPEWSAASEVTINDDGRQRTMTARYGFARVETIILHASGEWLSGGVVSVPVYKGDAQGYGSALTYVRRYSLSAAFGVAPEDDDGNEASKDAPQTTQRPKPAQEPSKAPTSAPKPTPADPNSPIGQDTADKFVGWANTNVKGGSIHMTNALKKYFPGVSLSQLTNRQAGDLRAHLEGKKLLSAPAVGDSDDQAIQAAQQLERDIAIGADVADNIRLMHKHRAFDGDDATARAIDGAGDNRAMLAEVARTMKDMLIGTQAQTA